MEKDEQISRLQTEIKHLRNELELTRKEREYSLNKYRELYNNMEDKVNERSKIISDQNAVLHREIHERKQIEKELVTAVKQKKYLLQEVHHRVKNNMQVISSLLNLQLRHIKDEKMTSILKDSQLRIRSMALVHEYIYNSDSLADVNLAEYLTTLTKNVYNSYIDYETNIRLEFDTKDIITTLESSIPCGLVVNEIITNSMKYAFRGVDGEGSIKLHLNQDKDKTIHLEVSDNGVGIPEGYEISRSKSLGIHLIHMLVEKQLRGNVSVDTTSGTTFHISFKSLNNSINILDD